MLVLVIMVVVVVVVVVADRRNAPVPADNALLADTSGAGTSDTAVKGLDISLAKDHLAGL
jgi:hypothetical protein